MRGLAISARVMRSVLTVLLLAPALAACGGPAPEPAEDAAPPAAVSEGPAAPEPSSTPTPTPAPNVAVTDLAALVGEYRVAGAGGKGIDLPHGVTARIDENGMIVDSGCVQLSWMWFFEGNRLVTERLFPRASCGRALLPEEEAIVAAMDGATGIGRTPANGVEIGGEDGAVLLFGQ